MSDQWQRKGKVRQSLVQVKSGLESAIYVALLTNVLSRVMQMRGTDHLIHFTSSQPSCYFSFSAAYEVPGPSVNQKPSLLRMFTSNSLKFN